MKIHLKIIYGCDDRYNLVKQVVPLCKDAFDTITIYNCGVREFTDKFTDLPLNCKIDYFDGFFGDMESMLRGMAKDVPEGEWLMWADADERPSQLFLDNIRADVEYLEANGYNSCRFPSVGHEDGMMWADLQKPFAGLPATLESYINSTTYAARKLVRKEKLYITSNVGAHYDYWSANGDKFYYFPHYIDHMKSKAQIGQSCALKSYTIDVNDFSYAKHAEIFASEEHRKLREFQKETGVKTSPHLFIKVNVEKDPEFIAKYTALLEQFKDSPIFTFKEMARILKTGINFDTVAYYCGRACCRYTNIQL